MTSDIKEKPVDVIVVQSEASKKKMTNTSSFFHVNKEMLLFKFHFFLFVGAMGLVYPFITIFAKTRVGLSGTELGALMTFEQFLFIFTKPVIGYIADYTNRLKAIICTQMVIFAIASYLLLAIPKSDNNGNYLSDPKIYNDSCQIYEFPTTVFKHDTELQLQECTENYVKWKIQNGRITYVDKQNLTFIPQLHCKSGITYTLPNQTYQLKDVLEAMNSWKLGEDVKMSEMDMSVSSISCCQSNNRTYAIFCNVPKQDSVNGRRYFTSYQFWLFSIIQVISGIGVNAMFTLSDTACYESVQKIGSDYGRQRLYGAVGWGLMSMVGGLMYDYTGDYVVAFSCMIGMTILTLYNLSKLDLVKPQYSQNILKDVGSVLKSVEFLAFLFLVLMCGMSTGVMWFYHAIFLISIGASRFVCGLSQFVQCFVGEIPFMFYSGWFLKKLGHYNVLTLNFLAYLARFMWYSYSHNPWYTLPVEIVHGITYGLFYPTLVSYSKMIAKPGTEATTQSIVFTTCEGLGAGIGCITFGMGYDIFGCHQMMFYYAIFSGFGAILSIIFKIFVFKKHGSDAEK